MMILINAFFVAFSIIPGRKMRENLPSLSFFPLLFLYF
ncbi:hypothetical protein FH5_04127 [Priestia endophytica]|nr:hypothetical protein FH5_04127 [Priestia endophytica]